MTSCQCCSALHIEFNKQFVEGTRTKTERTNINNMVVSTRLKYTDDPTATNKLHELQGQAVKITRKQRQFTTWRLTIPFQGSTVH